MACLEAAAAGRCFAFTFLFLLRPVLTVWLKLSSMSLPSAHCCLSPVSSQVLRNSIRGAGKSEGTSVSLLQGMLCFGVKQTGGSHREVVSEKVGKGKQIVIGGTPNDQCVRCRASLAIREV